MQLLGMTEVK